MNISEYSRSLDSTMLSFEGNNITSPCKQFVQGLLEKNINKRLSYDHAANHPWLILISEKVEEITSKFKSDPEKMISELNKSKLTDDFFKQKNYVDMEYSKEICSDDNSVLNKKRKRGKDNKK